MLAFMLALCWRLCQHWPNVGACERVSALKGKMIWLRRTACYKALQLTIEEGQIGAFIVPVAWMDSQESRENANTADDDSSSSR